MKVIKTIKADMVAGVWVYVHLCDGIVSIDLHLDEEVRQVTLAELKQLAYDLNQLNMQLSEMGIEVVEARE